MALVIPWQQLSDDALQGLIEEFVTRDGTDYGIEEVGLETRVLQVRRQLQRGEVVIIYSEVDHSCTLAPAAAKSFDTWPSP